MNLSDSQVWILKSGAKKSGPILSKRRAWDSFFRIDSARALDLAILQTKAGGGLPRFMPYPVSWA